MPIAIFILTLLLSCCTYAAEPTPAPTPEPAAVLATRYQSQLEQLAQRRDQLAAQLNDTNANILRLEGALGALRELRQSEEEERAK